MSQNNQTCCEERKTVGAQSTALKTAVNDASWMMRAFGASIAEACKDAARIHGLAAVDVEAAAMNGLPS